MKTGKTKTISALAASALAALMIVPAAQAAPTKKAPAKPIAKAPTKVDNAKADFNLPEKCYQGTPRNVANTTADKPTDKLRAPIYLPKGAKVVSKGAKVTASDEYPIVGTLSLVTDGIKDGTEGNWVELGPGTQWVQIDLGKPTTMYGVLLWHFHGESRVYRDVVVQTSNDANFVSASTIYNNDQDNSSGLGAGKQREFYDTYQGQWIGFSKPQKARYIRFYSRGNTSDPQNQYIEAEVWGDTAK